MSGSPTFCVIHTDTDTAEPHTKTKKKETASHTAALPNASTQKHKNHSRTYNTTLDRACAQVFSNCLKSSGRTGVIASEEEDVPVAVEQSYSGNYIVVFDPLDGSSNIDAAVSTGSIFGIYNPNDECLADVDDNDTVSAN